MNRRRWNAVSSWSSASLRLVAEGKKRRASVHGGHVAFIKKAEAKAVLEARANARQQYRADFAAYHQNVAAGIPSAEASPESKRKPAAQEA